MFRWRGFAVGVPVVLLVVAGPHVGRADEGEPANVRAQRLEHTLTYLAADYAGSTSNGVVADPIEHAEHLALAAEAVSMASRLPAPPDLGARVANVAALIRSAAPGDAVDHAVMELRTEILDAYEIAQAPTATPNGDRGRLLFEEFCATCHGLKGRADTLRAASLVPHPANFLDPRIGEPLSPYRVTTTVQFGISGTAMIPFTNLADADRWDLAFYVMGLRHLVPPIRDAPTYTRSELARSSDAALRIDLRATGVPEALVEPILADLRTREPYRNRARERALAIARAHLDRADVLIGRGHRDEALAAARAAEAEARRSDIALSRLDAALAREVAVALGAVDAQIAAGAPPNAVRAAIVEALRTVSRAERALWTAYSQLGSRTIAVRSAWDFVRGVGLAVLFMAALVSALWHAGEPRKNRRVHAAWIGALAFGVVVWLASRRVATPASRRDIVAAVASLLGAAGALALAATLRRDKAEAGGPSSTTEGLVGALLAAAPFAVACGAAFDVATLFPSMLASGVARAPVVGGMCAAAAALGIAAAAYAGAARFVTPRVALRAARGLLIAVSIAFLAQSARAVVAPGRVVPHGADR